MDNNQEIRNSQQSSRYLPYSFLEKDRAFSMNENMFLEDFCAHLAISLGKRNEYTNFYKIDEKKRTLKNLLEYENHMFLEYDFDKLLTRNLIDLLKYGKAYAEVIKYMDEEGKLIGIRIVPFRNNLQISIGDKIYYLLRKYDGKLEKGKIDKENVVAFNTKDIGYKRIHLKKMFRKLHALDDLSVMDLLQDNKSGFELDVYNKKKDLELLKVGHKFRWIARRTDNYYINRPYLMYLRMEELKLKERILSNLVNRYNEKLFELGRKYGFEGKICFESRTLTFNNLFDELMTGVKNCDQVSNEIY